MPASSRVRLKRFGRRLAVVTSIVVVGSAGLAAPALAHAVLEFTQPVDGAVLAVSPNRVVMGFDEAVEIPLGSVAVYNSAGHRVDQGLPFHPGGRASQVATNLPSGLRPGGYVVTWRVISADSHPVHGAFTFQVGAGGSAAATQREAAGLLNAQQGSRTVGIVFGVDRAVGYMSIAVLVGAGLLLTRAWPDGLDDPAVRRLVWAFYLVGIITTAGAVLLQGAYGAALPLASAGQADGGVVGAGHPVRQAVPDPGRHPGGRIGPLLWIQTKRRQPGRLARWWRPPPSSRRWRCWSSPALADHASTGSLVPFSISFDLVHLSAVSIWVGGLALLATVGLNRPTGPAGACRSRPSFLQWALGSVLAITISGGFAALAGDRIGAQRHHHRLRTPGPGQDAHLRHHRGSRTLSRRLTHGNLAIPLLPRGTGRDTTTTAPRLSPGPGAAPAHPGRLSGRLAVRASRLRRPMSVELTLAAAALSLAAVLVNVQPARQAVNQPLSSEVHAGPDRPGRSGPGPQPGRSQHPPPLHPVPRWHRRGGTRNRRHPQPARPRDRRSGRQPAVGRTGPFHLRRPRPAHPRRLDLAAHRSHRRHRRVRHATRHPPPALTNPSAVAPLEQGANPHMIRKLLTGTAVIAAIIVCRRRPGLRPCHRRPGHRRAGQRDHPRVPGPQRGTQRRHDQNPDLLPQRPSRSRRRPPKRARLARHHPYDCPQPAHQDRRRATHQLCQRSRLGRRSHPARAFPGVLRPGPEPAHRHQPGRLQSPANLRRRQYRPLDRPDLGRQPHPRPSHPHPHPHRPRKQRVRHHLRVGAGRPCGHPGQCVQRLGPSASLGW